MTYLNCNTTDLSGPVREIQPTQLVLAEKNQIYIEKAKNKAIKQGS